MDGPDSWPVVTMDMLAAYAADGTYRRRPACFLPLRTPRQKAAGTPPADEQQDDVVENEPGLCDVLSGIARRLDKAALCPHSRMVDPASPPAVPDLAALTAQQQLFDFPLRETNAPTQHELASPLLFSAVVHNRGDDDAVVSALGSRWLLPRRSAFFLGRSQR